MKRWKLWALLALMLLGVFLFSGCGPTAPTRGTFSIQLQTPSPTPEATPEATPTPTPEATPEATPSPTPEETPEVTSAPTPEPTPAPTPKAPPAPTPTPEETPDPTPEATEREGQEYVLNNNTKKFHYPDCGSVKTIKDKNREEYTGTREELIGRGYSPCGRCHP